MHTLVPMMEPMAASFAQNGIKPQRIEERIRFPSAQVSQAQIVYENVSRTVNESMVSSRVSEVVALRMVRTLTAIETHWSVEVTP